MLMITICGRLTRDASIRFTADGSPVLGFDVACDVGYGQNKHPVYVKCSLWGKRAEPLDPYLKKGLPVTVIGAGDLNTWEKKDGSGQGAGITLNVSEVVMQGGKQEKAEAEPQQQGFRDKPKMAAPAQDDAFADDDIPF